MLCFHELVYFHENAFSENAFRNFRKCFSENAIEEFLYANNFIAKNFMLNNFIAKKIKLNNFISKNFIA
jgi:hypothetical protein